MPLVPYNSVGGFSTGLTMTGVIDDLGNITGVGATFTGTFSGATGSFSRLLTASAGISAAGSTFSSTTNTLDIIASTDGAGLRIAQAATGSLSRRGGIRLGRSGTTGANTYLENSIGTFTIYNGVDTTGSKIVDFTATTTGFSGDVTATGLISAVKGISAAGGVTFSGNFSGATGSFSRLLTASGGINAAGAAFSSDVYANASLYTDYIQHSTAGQLNIDNVSGGRVAIGDYDQNGNNTSIFLRDNNYTIDIINPYGEIRMGDINALSTGFYIYYYADEARLTGNSSNITDFASIFANDALYENNRRVTTNARSWFL